MQKMIRAIWCCKICGNTHQTTLRRADAIILANQLLIAEMTDLLTLEDEASAMTDDLDEADEVVAQQERERQIATLIAHGLVLPDGYALGADFYRGALGVPYDPSRYRKD